MGGRLSRWEDATVGRDYKMHSSCVHEDAPERFKERFKTSMRAGERAQESSEIRAKRREEQAKKSLLWGASQRVGRLERARTALIRLVRCGPVWVVTASTSC